MWLGGKQNDDDDGFSWVDGSPVNKGPNNWTNKNQKKNGKKQCLSINFLGDGLWHTQSCTGKYPFLCQFILEGNMSRSRQYMWGGDKGIMSKRLKIVSMSTYK